MARFVNLHCISYDSGNKLKLFPYTAQPVSLYNGAGVCLLWSGKLICKWCLEFELLSSAACAKQSDSLTWHSFFLIAFASDIYLSERNEQVLSRKLHNREVFCHSSSKKYSGFDFSVSQPFFQGWTLKNILSYPEEPLAMRTFTGQKKKSLAGNAIQLLLCYQWIYLWRSVNIRKVTL